MMADMSTGGIVAVLSVGGFLAMGLIQITGTLIRDSLRSRRLEQSRREIAAYVAEGSITPADAERLINAGQGAGQSANHQADDWAGRSPRRTGKCAHG